MNYPRLFSKPAAILMALVFVFSAGCQLDVPLKEMVTAKRAIDSAKGVDAEKYSPDELSKAEGLLLKSHDLLTDKKEKEAKQTADDAAAAALEAEKKALPLYADAHIRKGEESYAEADRAYAERFSPEKFMKAGELNSEANQNYEKGDYRSAAENAKKASVLAEEARDESLQNSSAIEDQIRSLESRYNNLKSNSFSSSAGENLSKAAAAISSAGKAYKERDYKTAFAEIRNGEIELDAANLIIVKKGMYDRVEKLRGELSSIKKEGLSEDVKSDLDSALLALNAAEASLEQNYIEDADMRIKEAETLIAGADNKMKEKNALAALAKPEKLLNEARGKESTGNYSDNLNKAEGLIQSGKNNVADKKYNEGISNAEEAETIIAAVLNSIESEIAEAKLRAAADADKEKDTATKDEETAGDTEIEKAKPEGRTYTVQWRKKNTDCLWRIAQKVYNDAAYWPAIYIANRDQIKDPDLIFPGQKFVIPPKPKKRPSYKEIVAEEKKAIEKDKEPSKEDVKEKTVTE